MRRGESLGYKEGRMLENDTFGNPSWKKGYEQTRRSLIDQTREKNGWLPYRQAMDLVREFNGDDPENPGKEFANDLRIELLDTLEMGDEQSSRLRFYSAIGSELDKWHGIDAFIEYDSAETGRIVITLDVTANEDKLKSGHKADIIIGNVPIPSSDEYLDNVDEYVKEIAQAIQTKIESEKARTGVRNFEAVDKAPAKSSGRRRVIDLNG